MILYLMFKSVRSSFLLLAKLHNSFSCFLSEGVMSCLTLMSSRISGLSLLPSLYSFFMILALDS